MELKFFSGSTFKLEKLKEKCTPRNLGFFALAVVFICLVGLALFFLLKEPPPLENPEDTDVHNHGEAKSDSSKFWSNSTAVDQWQKSVQKLLLDWGYRLNEIPKPFGTLNPSTQFQVKDPDFIPILETLPKEVQEFFKGYKIIPKSAKPKPVTKQPSEKLMKEVVTPKKEEILEHDHDFESDSEDTEPNEEEDDEEENSEEADGDEDLDSPLGRNAEKEDEKEDYGDTYEDDDEEGRKEFNAIEAKLKELSGMNKNFLNDLKVEDTHAKPKIDAEVKAKATPKPYDPEDAYSRLARKKLQMKFLNSALDTSQERDSKPKPEHPKRTHHFYSKTYDTKIRDGLKTRLDNIRDALKKAVRKRK